MASAARESEKFGRSWRSYPFAMARAAKSIVRHSILKVHGFMDKLSARNRVFAAVYYSLFNHEMMRELQSVSAGKVRYKSDNDSELMSYYLLRRNIHRLEKGLIMRPRRAVFALDFIDETVKIFLRATHTKDVWNDELVWANDVLTDYFAAVDHGNAKVAAAYQWFSGVIPPPGLQIRSDRAVPYARDLSGAPPVDFDSFMALTRRRRSVRWFENRMVDRELIDKALAAAAQSPSACNRQPFHFRIFDQPDAVRDVINIPMGTKGFADNVPAVAVIVGQLRAYPFERDRHVIYIDGALAAMTFMLSLETLGIASCPINWPDQEPHESRMKRTLKLDDDERVVMLIALGWPDADGKVAYSTKRTVDSLRVYN